MSGSHRPGPSALLPIGLLVIAIAVGVPGTRDFFARETLLSLLDQGGWWVPIAFALWSRPETMISSVRGTYATASRCSQSASSRFTGCRVRSGSRISKELTLKPTVEI